MDPELAEVPAALVTLIEWLHVQSFKTVRDTSSPANFGDRYLRLARDDTGVRLVRDRGQWFIDLSARAWGGGWFDVPLVMAALQHEDARNAPDLAQQAAFVREHLDGPLSDPGRTGLSKVDLERLRERRFHERMGTGEAR